MSNVKKRSYSSKARDKRASETKERILSAAKTLFARKGFEGVTIEAIAEGAKVSIPTVYGLFQSKRGILRALMDAALPSDEFQSLVEESKREDCPKTRLAISAKIARQIYDAERTQMTLLQGAALLAPEFKEFEQEREKRRYVRQEITIQAMVEEGSLAKGLSAKKARDILWAFTGRDLYRMFVIEQGWSSDAYEKWLAEALSSALICL